MVKIEKILTKAPGVSATGYLENEIAGLHPLAWTAEAGQTLSFNPCGYYHILVLVTGKAVFESDGSTFTSDGKCTYVPAPDKALTVRAETDIYLMEFAFDKKETDTADIVKFGTKFPLAIPYQDSIQYIDPYKSQKTISRMMLPHEILPRFSMGSVETWGDDLVKPHTHPMLDQLFFSFPENDMDVLIDGSAYPMGGDMILHIPLGSDHGVKVDGSRHLHYMWIDVMPDQAKGLERLNRTHKPTGLNRSFGADGKEN